MKPNLKFITIVLILSLIFSACKKIKGDNENIKDPNQTVSGYMSTVEGSWWLYASRDGVVIKRNATGLDSVKMGFVYNYYETVDTNTQALTPEYFAKNGDKYTMLIDMDGTKTNYIMAIVQKDNANVGDTWKNTKSLTYSGIPVDILIEGEVTGLNQTITINNHTFTNVTEVKNILKAKPSFLPYAKCGEVKMWFSKGVGVIKTDFDLNIMGLYTRKYVDSLIDYNIIP